MTPPYYQVVIENLTRGWTFAVSHGDPYTIGDPVVLADPFTWEWEFADDIIPSPDIRFTGKLQLAAERANDVPQVEVGDRIQLDLRTLPDHIRWLYGPPMRVASAETLLTSGAYQARVSVGLVDLSVDWRERVLVGGVGTAPQNRMQWRERLAEQAKLLGLPMGAPTSWPGLAQPRHPFTPGSIYTLVNYLTADGYPGKAVEAIARTLNSYQPNGETHTIVTIEANAHPTGYSYVGPSSWDASVGWGAIAEATGTERIELVPASRSTPASSGLPLVFTSSGGLLTVAPVQPPAGGSLAQLAIDASWCKLPAKARKSREGVINQVIFTGSAGYTDPDTGLNNVVKDGDHYTYSSSDVAARGASPRDPGTEFWLGNRYTGSNPYPVPWPAVTDTAPYYVADPAGLAAPWTYDSFELHAKLIPDDVAPWLLPIIAPRVPGDPDGDGRLVRHVTIYGIDPDLRFDGQPVLGFVVAGQLAVTNGEIVFQLDTIPGAPTYTGGTVTPVTVGDVQAAGYGTLTTPNVDPTITVAELAYIDS